MTISNTDFGRRVGVSPSMASRIRSGDRLPSTAVMLKIADEFGIPLAELATAHRTGSEAFGSLVSVYAPPLAAAA